MNHAHRNLITHTITEEEAKAGHALAVRWLEFAQTRKISPLVISIAVSVVHTSIAEQSRVIAGGTEEEADELLRTLIALARGAAQS